jgi:protein-L-isoaspartate(D-aspartate) O-methyltransferase
MSYYQAHGDSNNELVSQLKNYGIIRSIVVMEAMKKTDRGLYSKNSEEAYSDRPHSIGYGVTISAPHMHATALELLKDHASKPGAHILDVGSGSGYLTACMARLADKNAKVVGIDIVKPLIDWSIHNLNRDDPELIKSGKVTIKYGDGWKGDPDHAPFDVIHVGAAAETLPQTLVDQLKPEGRMIIPIGTWDQNLVQVDKDRHGKIVVSDIMGVRYVPLVRDEYREKQ